MKPRPRNLDSLPRHAPRDSPEIPPSRIEKEEELHCELEEVYTEEIMLPFASNEHIHFQRNNSDFLKDRSRPSLPPDLLPLNSCQLDHHKNQGNRHPKLSRESLQEMNKKQRNIRTSHYRTGSKASQNPPLNLLEELEAESPFLTARELPLSNQKIFTRKSIMSSYAQRAVNSIMRGEPPTPKRAASTHEMRRRKGSGQAERAWELRKHNPLVIYPFESRLKSKRVDDNPKILGNIIRKKFKQMEKDDLYLYIDGIVHRRAH